ncbi:MAG: Rha family transcriptional regulator [Desulfobacterium sp.]|nr:Rha family transcriptional regulator [Desulfobacterium sp.]
MMQDSLVEVKRNSLSTTSLVVAEKFGKRHDDILKKIKNLIGDDEGGRLNFAESSYRNLQNKKQKMYNMNRRTFSILVMGFTGKKAMEWKHRFYDAFEAMERALLRQQFQSQEPAWIAQRQSGKLTRREETDTIKEFVKYAIAQGSKSANRYYMAISKMQNKSLFLLEQKFKNLRDVLNLRQLATIDNADAIVSKALQDGMAAHLHYKDIYKLAKSRVEAFADLRGKTFIPATQQLELKRA